jgi:predicted hotdog family 3-hydroxylacyl-ACP dehydratase
MRIWPLLFVAALALGVYSGLLRAQDDPPAWSLAVYAATVILAAAAEALRRGSKTSPGGPDGPR